MPGSQRRAHRAQHHAARTIASGGLALAVAIAGTGCAGPSPAAPGDAAGPTQAATTSTASAATGTTASAAPGPSPTRSAPATMTRAEAAAYFERAGCPATQARDEVFSFVDRDYGDVDLEGVAAAAADAIRAYRRAAARLADPPRPWPQFLAGNVADLRAELVLGASQLEPIVTVRNQVDLAEAWSRMAELPTRLSVRSVRLLLRWSPKDTDRPGCRR